MIDPAQTGLQGLFVSALVIVLRLAEKRLDKSRNGPVYPRVRYLEDRIDEMDLQLGELKREDLAPRLEAVERFVRQRLRENE